jgi:hypothetical protein
VAFRNRVEVISYSSGIVSIEGSGKTHIVISNSCCVGFIGSLEGNLESFEGSIILEGFEGCGMGRQDLD